MPGFPWIDRILRMLERRRAQRYWERRARHQGASAVLNRGHDPADLEELTRQQLGLLLPLLRAELHGDERVILDFGCGAGRFTRDLARAIGGRAIGVDPVAQLVALAPSDPDVEYRTYAVSRLPLADASVDVAWVSVVFCNITDARAARDAAQEIDRVLKPGGLVFLNENTTPDRAPMAHVVFRSVAEYQGLFPWARLRHLHDHLDLGERLSVLAGRKAAQEA